MLAQKEPMESRTRSNVQRDVVGARIWLFTIKLIEGKASEEEKKYDRFLVNNRKQELRCIS